MESCVHDVHAMQKQDDEEEGEDEKEKKSITCSDK